MPLIRHSSHRFREKVDALLNRDLHYFYTPMRKHVSYFMEVTEEELKLCRTIREFPGRSRIKESELAPCTSWE